MARHLVKLTLLRAPRCDECERQETEFGRVRREAPAGVEFRDIDIDVNPDAAKFHRAREHPTLVLEKDGHEVQRWTGVVGADDLLAALRKHVEPPRARPYGPGTPMLSGQTTAATGGPGRVAMPPEEDRLPGVPSPMEPPPSTPP
jgi:thioredoxin-like negative regulator of GroEL